MTPHRHLWGIVILCCSWWLRPTDSGAVQLNSANIDETLASNEHVLLNFYADWCRFSNMLAPIWDETADKVAQEFANSEHKVLVGKVDCDKESSLGTRFHITKYPTLKYVHNGVVSKREYRGQRSAEAFVTFLKEQTRDPVVEIKELNDLNELDSKKRHILGYFVSKSSPEYENFRKVAGNFKDDCLFYAGFGEVVERMHPPGQSIVAFRPNKARSNEDDETFTGNLFNHDELSIWSTDKCTPMVREITFENAEELTEEGLPFLILFHAPDDDKSIKEFTDVVKKELQEDKQNVNFLIADGKKFAHPLHHLGKSEEDLPLLAIDSFRHMYLFPKYEDIHQPLKIKQFLKDLYSGKLHREFHYGPDKETTSEGVPSTEGNRVQGNNANRVPETKTKDPPPSQFQHLGPSKNRYTLLRDEF